MSHLGTDFHCVEDIDFNLSTVSGRRGLAESIVRRLQVRLGDLFYDPDYGTEVIGNIGSASDILRRLEQAVESEALKDERVERIRTTATYVRETETMNIEIRLTDENGPFDFTISVDQLSVELLRIDG